MQHRQNDTELDSTLETVLRSHLLDPPQTLNPKPTLNPLWSYMVAQVEDGRSYQVVNRVDTSSVLRLKQELDLRDLDLSRAYLDP